MRHVNKIKLAWTLDRGDGKKRDSARLIGTAGTAKVAVVIEAGGWELLDVPTEVRRMFDEEWVSDRDPRAGAFIRIRGDNDGEAMGYPNETVPRPLEDCASAEDEYHKLRMWKRSHRRRTTPKQLALGSGR